jgi:hypothetical protein
MKRQCCLVILCNKIEFEIVIIEQIGIIGVKSEPPVTIS